MTIAHRILLHVATGVALLVGVVTAVTYARVYDAVTERSLQHLATYVDERARREEARFQQVQSNLLLVRGQFLKRLEAPVPPGLLSKWDLLYRLYPDGAWRSRESFKDARRYASLWAHKGWSATPEMRRQVLVAQELCDEMLPGWVDSFPSYYFFFPGPVNVGVDTSIPTWPWDMPADFEGTGIEWFEAALPKPAPARDGFTWTGVQVDRYTPEASVSVYLPVFRDGVFLGSVGHNINVSMESTLDDATRSALPGATHIIFREDGRLIAHSRRRADILATKGLLTAQASSDATLASLHRLATARRERRFAGYDDASAHYYSVARLAGPEWFYVTTMSRDHLRGQAFASAQWVLWSGLLSLLLVLGVIAGVVRRQVARPLAELTRAAEALSAGADSVPVPRDRADELGVLARSFGAMIERVAAREHDLRQLNLDLERRVAERTQTLNQALAREREVVELKSSFVSLVSHEFRTPLGVILSAVEVLQRYFERLTADERGRHLGMIFRSTKNLSSLVDGVLLLSRVEERRVGFTPGPVDLDKLGRALCDEIGSATGGSCPIRFHAATPLEGAVSDETILRHIVANLLSNACKYSEPGRPVELTVERRGGDAVLVVRDRGIGIPAEDRKHLFTSFTRGGNVGGRPGTGLGLVIVQRCVQLHGGTLAIESEVGAGTTATVTLPMFP